MGICEAIKRKFKRQVKGSRPRASARTPSRESPNSAGAQQHLGIGIHTQTIVHSPSIHTDTGLVTTETSPAATNGLSPPTPILIHDPPTRKATNSNIWADAYEKFANREPKLAKDYNTHLATISGDDTVPRTDFSNPSWAKSIVERLQKNREDKQWHIIFHGRDIGFREQAEKLAKVFLWCNGIVKDALSAQPYAALAWSGISILLPLLTSATAQHETMLLHFDAINHVQIYWKAYQDTFSEEFRLDNGMTTDLVELYSHIFEYQARTICHLSRAQLSRGWDKVTGGNDWEGKASQVKALSERCKDRIGIAQAKETQVKCDQHLEQVYKSRAALEKIYDVLEEQRKERRSDLEDKQERELLADLAADHEAYKNFNPIKVENTCGWFLKDKSFRSWRDSEESSLLWVSAGPGCGKSVLSRSLIDEWQLSTSAATSTVCYFFFKDGDERRDHSANAFSSILHQLFMRDMTGKFMSHALHRHKNYGKTLATNFSQLWDILLACAATPNAGEIVCVLDALDECKEGERNNIIIKLKDFFSGAGEASRQCRLKFFITSRPYDTIERPIRSILNSACLQIDGDDHSAAVNEDIDRVIDAKVPELMFRLSEEDRRRISKRLKDMKNRTYLWLRLTFYILEHTPSDYNRSSDIESLLNNLPDEHSKAYEKILNQKQSKYTRILFQLMLAAQRPLSAEEANHALTIATAKNSFTSHSKIKEDLWNIHDFKNAAKNFCGLLVDFHDSGLSFIHQTVRDFLTECPQESGEWNWRGRFKLSECHSAMAVSCIRYLSVPDFDTLTPGTTPNWHIYPFYAYAIEKWSYHYRHQDQDTPDYVVEEVRNICRPQGEKARKRMIVDTDSFFAKIYLRPLQRIAGERTDLAFAARFGLTRVVQAILDEYVNIDTDGEFINTALREASARGFLSVVEILLDTKADVNAPDEFNNTSISSALQRGHLAVAELILEKRGEQVQVTEAVIVAAAKNMESGDKNVALLLEKQGEQVQVTEAVIVAAAENTRSGDKIMALLLEKRGEQVQVTEAVIVAAAGNMRSGDKIMALLLEKRGEQVQVTEAVIVAAAGNWMLGVEIISLLLEKRGEQVQVTEAVIVAAAENWMLGVEIISLLLEKRGEQVQVTEAIIIAAAINRGPGVEIISLFLEKKGEQVQVTEAVIIAAESNTHCGKKIIALLERAGKQFQKPEAIAATLVDTETP
ncbi:hypothetical protein F4803DRAFT_243029 [Xylaria telfairii]|nr:hypothetical protein F4803DRAFT_243029 [Xylaria telfairii]